MTLKLVKDTKWDIDVAKGELWPPDGCWKHESCFTCPLPDCSVSDSIKGKARKDYHKQGGEA